MTALTTAQLAIFLVLSFPALYSLIRHGKRGFLGWFYVLLFCAIRVAGSALALKDERSGTTSMATIVVSTLGLSPLLLASMGIIHEARKARVHHLGNRWEWFIVIQYHAFVAIGMVIVAWRTPLLTSGIRTSADQTLLDAGLAVIGLSWGLLCMWIPISLLPHKKQRNAVNFEDGTKLLYAVLLCVPLMGLRIIYVTVFYIVSSQVFDDSLAVKVCLSVVPEMVVTVILVVVGVITRNMGKMKAQETQGKPYGYQGVDELHPAEY